MRRAARGFTLIELLVAMAILGVIVVVCGQIFEQATTSWNTGVRKAEMNIVGRGVADFIAQDISRCVMPPGAPPQLSGSPVIFTIIDESSVPANPKARRTITYKLGNPPTRQVDSGTEFKLAPPGMVQGVVVTRSPDGGHVDVTVTVKEDDARSTFTKSFKARAWLANRDRYEYE